MTLLEQIKADNLVARKNKQGALASLLTTLVSEIDMIGKNDGSRISTDDEAKVVIRKFIKNAGELISLSKGIETEGVLKARGEIYILKTYLPTSLTVEELRGVINDTIAGGASDTKSVMAKLKSDYVGRYDGKVASMLIKEMLK